MTHLGGHSIVTPKLLNSGDLLTKSQAPRFQADVVHITGAKATMQFRTGWILAAGPSQLSPFAQDKPIAAALLSISLRTAKSVRILFAAIACACLWMCSAISAISSHALSLKFLTKLSGLRIS